MEALALALLLTLVSAVSSGLAPPERSYKVLMLLPVSSKSHRNVFMPIAETLAERGHKVVMLVNHPPASKHPNIEEIRHGLPDFNEENMDMFDGREDHFSMFQTALPAMARKLYKVPQVQELYARRKEFDLIMIDQLFNEVTYPFAHEMTFITVATAGMDPRQSAVFGNVLNPAYVSSFIHTFPLPMSMIQRFTNTLFHIMTAFVWRHRDVVPRIQKEISAQFPDVPPLLDIERNQSLVLMNTHFSMRANGPLPLLPSQVEVGGMHCRPGKSLPEDLESFINGAGPEGVVYFSLGSVARGTSLPVAYRDMFLEAFKKLKQRVIWKFEGDIKEIPRNVLMRKWLPQQDILAHPSVKVFITHGGLLSIQEALYHTTPVLVLPIFGDQPRNGREVEMSGQGLMLTWEELSEEQILKSLQQLIYDPKYTSNLEALRGPLRDQLESPTERAVFWTEYVIRHKGAPQLRCPAARLSWVEYLMLDVLLVLHLSLFVLLWVLRRFVRVVRRKVFGDKGQGTKKKRE